MQPKCSDYFIVKLRCWADKRLLKKYKANGGPIPKQQHERCKLHNIFYWKFIKRLTKKDMTYWYMEYPFYAKECLQYDLQEQYGIIVIDNLMDGWCFYFIPRKHKKLYEWIIKNANVPFKVVTRTYVYFINRFIEKSDDREYVREQARKTKIRFETAIKNSKQNETK